ncbi:hypothetical protein [Saccharopolyspora halophila]|uniref:hypothetical protein n=1 Tax=Saccharopolyspora halophila TaxID=405551 RepID=UPI0031D82400
MLGDRAVALARRTGDQTSRLSAETLAIFASNRLGHGVAVTGRALAAVREAESAGDAEILTRLRIELAWCAASAGSYEVALRVLRGELERNHDEPALRAHALLAMAAALPGRQDVDERARVLDEAERLYSGSSSNRDVTGLLTARVRAARAGHLRRRSEFGGAVEAADSGLELLDGLTDPDADGGGVRARLELDRVQALLDLGRRPEGLESARSALGRPVRAAEAGPIGWLGLAVATRVHLPAGDTASAMRVLTDTAAIAQRHDLDCLLAETLNVLSHAHEGMAEVEAALRTLRESHTADRRWRSSLHDARMSLLAEFPPEHGKPAAAGPVLAAVAPEQRSTERPAEHRAAGQPRRRRRAAPEAPAAAEQHARSESVAPEPEPEAPVPAAGEQQPEPAPSPEHRQPARSGPRRRRDESIEPDWANFLGLAVDNETSGTAPAESRHETKIDPEPEIAAEPEPAVAPGPEPEAAAAPQVAPEVGAGAEPETTSVEQQIAEHIGAEGEASSISGYAATQDAARKLLETLTSRAEEAEGPADQERPAGNAEPSEPAEPTRHAEPEGPMPEPRVEFAGLGDEPPWLAERSSNHAEPGADETTGGRHDGGEWGYADPLAAASASLRWITAEAEGHAPAAHEPDEEDAELPGLVDDDRSPEAGQPRATATSLLEQLGIDLGAYGAGSSPSQPETQQPDDPQPDDPQPAGAQPEAPQSWANEHQLAGHQATEADVAESPVTADREVGQPEVDEGVGASSPDSDGDETGGRRSRGKTLAEIRAGLELPAEHRPSRRRRYSADDETAAESPAAPERTTPPEPAPEPEPEPEPSSDAGLADLLAEAMKAYEVGNRDDTAGASGGSRSGGTHRSAGAAEESAAQPARSTSDDSRDGPGARHRRPGFDAAAADPLL